MSFFDRISNHMPYVRITVIIGAGMWGLFWIPLRALGESGISPAWSSVLFYFLPFVILIPLGVKRWQSIRQGGMNLMIIGFFFGLAMTFYANAYFFSDVVRVLLLYYLLPVWGTILGRIFLGEPITFLRVISIVLGFAGLLVIFGLGDGIPWPRNIGDWMGLIAGLLWAVGSLLANKADNCKAFDTTFVFFGWAAVTGVAMLLIPKLGQEAIPTVDHILNVMPWMIFVAILLVIPTCFICIWGAGLLTPGHLGVLYLSEISVGVIGATILTDEVFGLREFLGVALISSAGLREAFGHKAPSPEPASPPTEEQA